MKWKFGNKTGMLCLSEPTGAVWLQTLRSNTSETVKKKIESNALKVEKKFSKMIKSQSHTNRRKKNKILVIIKKQIKKPERISPATSRQSLIYKSYQKATSWTKSTDSYGSTHCIQLKVLYNREQNKKIDKTKMLNENNIGNVVTKRLEIK